MKLTKIFTKDLTSKLKELLISRDQDGSYKLFNKYNIAVSQDGLYTVHAGDLEIPDPSFSSLKHAVTWCTLTQLKKYKETKRLQELDLQVASEDIEITLLKKRITTALDTESKSIYQAKYYEHILKKRKALAEMEEYVIESKYWQSKKFQESSPAVLKQKDKYSDKIGNNYHEIDRSR